LKEKDIMDGQFMNGFGFFIMSIIFAVFFPCPSVMISFRKRQAGASGSLKTGVEQESGETQKIHFPLDFKEILLHTKVGRNSVKNLKRPQQGWIRHTLG
jgi:hypothetical protein